MLCDVGLDIILVFKCLKCRETGKKKSKSNMLRKIHGRVKHKTLCDEGKRVFNLIFELRYNMHTVNKCVLTEQMTGVTNHDQAHPVLRGLKRLLRKG